MLNDSDASFQDYENLSRGPENISGEQYVIAGRIQQRTKAKDLRVVHSRVAEEIKMR